MAKRNQVNGKGWKTDMSKLNILHLLSNWKWTEISEPAIELALAQRRLGASVDFVCGRDPIKGSRFGIEYHAGLKGLDCLHVLEMPKHFKVAAAFSDTVYLRRLLKRRLPHVIHCHKHNAHLMGSFIRGLSKPPVIVTSCYDPAGPGRDMRSRLLFKMATDGLVVINAKSKHSAIASHGFSPSSIQVAEPGIELSRFDPQREISEDTNRFGLNPEAFVIGMVTRIRDARRIDVVLKALRSFCRTYPRLRLLLVGRGSQGAAEAVVQRPAREMGILDKVIMPGYCDGDRLVAAYRKMDVLIYPIPGSDQTCRTVREALAAGVPVIAPRIGFLPELIDDCITGRLMDFSSQNLVPILKELMDNPNKLHEMSRRALESAIQRFAPEQQAQKTITLYQRLLKGSES